MLGRGSIKKERLTFLPPLTPKLGGGTRNGSLLHITSQMIPEMTDKRLEVIRKEVISLFPFSSLPSLASSVNPDDTSTGFWIFGF